MTGSCGGELFCGAVQSSAPATAAVTVVDWGAGPPPAGPAELFGSDTVIGLPPVGAWSGLMPALPGAPDPSSVTPEIGSVPGYWLGWLMSCAASGSPPGAGVPPAPES